MGLIDNEPIRRLAAADLSARLWRFGKETSTGIAACSVAGERADGVIAGGFPSTPNAAGKPVDMQIERLIKVESGAPFAAGADLTTDTVGRAVTAGAGDNINAIACDAATAAGQLVQVRPPYSRNAGTASTIANAAVSPATTPSGALVVIPIDIPDAATTTYSYINQEKLEIIDVIVIKDVAGAGNTIQVKTAGGTAISDAIAAAVDKAVTRAGTLDKAQRTLTAAAGFQITATRAAGSMAAQVFVKAIKRA